MPSDEGDVLDLLSRGEVEVLGLLPYSSNYTFLAKVGADESAVHAVYKPRRGERPLWDFPQGTLAAREVAAFVVSEASGWDLVPATVLRPDAPLGEGSLQLFVHHDPERHFFVMQDEGRYDFRVFAAFDAVINNADRKGGHVIEDSSGRLWAVDHGVTFHVEPKLRTVIWDYAEQELGAAAREGLEKLRDSFGRDDGLASELEGLLVPEEIEATRARVEALLEMDRFPIPETDRPLPWPLI